MEQGGEEGRGKEGRGKEGRKEGREGGREEGVPHQTSTAPGKNFRKVQTSTTLGKILERLLGPGGSYKTQDIQ